MNGEESPARAPLLLLDTHTLVWSINEGPKLGKGAKEAIRVAGDDGRILVSAITPWEVSLLVSKGRLALQADVMDWVRDALRIPGLTLAPLEPEIAVASTRLPFEMHPDPADRILVATARHLGATLVTADKALLELARNGHFKALDAAA
ncbi:MAG: type II toxin-antitoxin system VapC family toxin [Terracidiphilus sp.]